MVGGSQEVLRYRSLLTTALLSVSPLLHFQPFQEDPICALYRSEETGVFHNLVTPLNRLTYIHLKLLKAHRTRTSIKTDVLGLD